MIVNRNYFIAPQQREALISLTALTYIEEHGLLTPPQIEDAKNSLQALFLRASGEETLLRKLIDVLKATRHLHHSFASISNILSGAGKGVGVIEEKLAALRARIEQMPMTAEAHKDFIGPFLSFSQQFLEQTAGCKAALTNYLTAREHEARTQSLYQIALEARERLRHRLQHALAQPTGSTEQRIKDEIVSRFDYGEAGATLEEARRATEAIESDMQERLREIQSMCWLAMNPLARDKYLRIDPNEDIFTRFVEAIPRHVCLAPLKEAVLELFKLYQHSHGMFQLDYQKLRRALDTMMGNTDEYFQAKEDDRDLAAKREKLRKIEGLIPFLEQAVRLAEDENMEAYPTFSRQLSAAISERRAAWNHIAEDLLRAKVQAEAEVSTRL